MVMDRFYWPQRLRLEAVSHDSEYALIALEVSNRRY